MKNICFHSDQLSDYRARHNRVDMSAEWSEDTWIFKP